MIARMHPLDSSKYALPHMANAIRILAMDAVEQAGSGHPGMPMGMADVATVLFTHFFQQYAADLSWPNRDRLVLSAGHGALLLYALLYLSGAPSMPLEALCAFRQWGSHAPGHPEHGPGIEATTGPLAQGLANAVGMALAERALHAEFSFINHRTYAIVSDGCLMEGLSQEAIALAGHWKLNRLIVLFDDNGITIDGSTQLSSAEDTLLRFQACQWATFSVDGHDPQAIYETIAKAQTQDRPSLIACRTRIGYGSPKKEGTSHAHGAPLGMEEVRATRANLNWPSETPFFIPDDILQAWRNIGKAHHETYKHWVAEVAKSDLAPAFAARQNGVLQLDAVFASLRKDLAIKRPHQATRKTSGEILKALTPHVPFFSGSADLGESTQVLPQGPAFSSECPEGRYLYYGVREHAMAAIMNGIALHQGFVPCGSTFLVFSDYARPAMRLSALMEQRVIYVMTHDSIGLGEDGPTHQPIEHLASLRAIPNLLVLRPADALEVAECWELALKATKSPSVLCLSRQSLPALRNDHGATNLSERGAYVLRPCSFAIHHVDLWATGSEVALACEVQTLLAEKNLGARVISIPCWERFAEQTEAYKKELDAPVLKVAIEAASPMGWERIVGCQGLIFGLDHFGASAPYAQLYTQFHLHPKAITEKICQHLTPSPVL